MVTIIQATSDDQTPIGKSRLWLTHPIALYGTVIGQLQVQSSQQ